MNRLRSSVLAHASIALLTTLALWFYAGGGQVAYTMDSLTYRDAALNLLAGHSLSATNVWGETPAHISLLQWPPGYPALWAAVVALTGLGIDVAPRLLNPLLLATTALALFWAALLLSGRPVVATLVSIAHASTPSSMAVFGHAWSETLFLPLVVLAFAALRKYGKHAGDTDKPLQWLILAALCIGLANWARYTGVIFLLLLPLTVLASSGRPLVHRAKHAVIVSLIGGVLVVPLWWRNFRLTGTLSGSERGGIARYPIDKLLGDIERIIEMFEHSLFNFDMLLRAHLEIPILAAAVFLLVRTVRRSGVVRLRSALAWLPLIWAGVGTAFLLYARIFQRDVDLDFRMLSAIVPFILLACVPLVNAAISAGSQIWQKSFLALMVGLIMHTGLQEAHRVHANYADHKAPGWRARFAFVYRDLSMASSTTRALKDAISTLTPGTLVLTDYRALYIRYLLDVRAYAVSEAENCRRWLRLHPQGVLLTGHKADTADWHAGTWVANCIGENPGWRVLRISGRGAHSLITDE